MDPAFCQRVFVLREVLGSMSLACVFHDNQIERLRPAPESDPCRLFVRKDEPAQPPKSLDQSGVKSAFL